MAKWGSDKTYLKVNNEVLPVEPNKGYTLTLLDYEQVDKTEAGTSVRSLTRTGIPSISVGLDCNKQMLQLLRSLRNLLSVDVYYYDPTANDDLAYDLMYVTNYTEKMIADIEGGGIWSVSFNLEDLDNVSSI